MPWPPALLTMNRPTTKFFSQIIHSSPPPPLGIPTQGPVPRVGVFPPWGGPPPGPPRKIPSPEERNFPAPNPRLAPTFFSAPWPNANQPHPPPGILGKSLGRTRWSTPFSAPVYLFYGENPHQKPPVAQKMGKRLESPPGGNPPGPLGSPNGGFPPRVMGSQARPLGGRCPRPGPFWFQ